MTQQRPLLFAENFTTHQEFRLRETTTRGMSIQIFLFLFWYTHVCVCTYVHICSVCQRPSFTYSKLWYLRYLTFLPEHHWEQRKLKVSARHLTKITSCSNNESGRTHLWKPSMSKLFSGTRCKEILKREHPMYLTCRDPTSGECG